MARRDLLDPRRLFVCAGLVLATVISFADPSEVVGADTAGASATSARGALQVPFSDSFDGPRGSKPDAARWQFQLGGGGWGNQELQTYTDSPANAALDGHGHLVISALRSGTPGHYTFTSARLASILAVGPHLHAEARIKMAPGTGLWPTFWLMGGDPRGSTWPITGEIDVAESVGRLPSTIIATAHGLNPDRPPPFHWQSSTWMKEPKPLSAAFHTYALDVTDQSLTWSMDGHPYKVLERNALPDPHDLWSFTTPFHVILSLAVGGTFGRVPTAKTRFPASMVVDYVKVVSTV